MPTTIYIAPDNSRTRGRKPRTIARNGGRMGVAADMTDDGWRAVGGGIESEADPVLPTEEERLTAQAAGVATTHPDVPGRVAAVVALIGYAVVQLGVDLPTDRMPTFTEIGETLLDDGTDEAYRLFTRGRLDWDVVLGACDGNYDLAYELAPYLAALDAGETDG
jgi:hypothetical protein